MRVAVFKRMPAWAAYPLHPFARILEAPAVSHVQLFFHEDRRWPIPHALDAFLYGLVGSPVQVYQSMGEPAVLDALEAGGFDVIFPDGSAYIGPSIRKHAKIGVLHFHQARLPEVRGLCSAEWSVMLGIAAGVTLTFCEAGMDLGDNLLIDEVGPEAKSIAAVKKACHDLGWDQIRRFCSDPDTVLAGRTSQDPTEGRTFYSMVQPLKQVVELRLSGKLEHRERASAGLRALGNSLPGEHDTEPLPDTPPIDLPATFHALKVSATYKKMDLDDMLLGALHFLVKREGATPEIAAPVIREIGRRVQAGFEEPIDRTRFFNELAQLAACNAPARLLATHPPVLDFLRTTAEALAADPDAA